MLGLHPYAGDCLENKAFQEARPTLEEGTLEFRKSLNRVIYACQ